MCFTVPTFSSPKVSLSQSKKPVLAFSPSPIGVSLKPRRNPLCRKHPFRKTYLHFLGISLAWNFPAFCDFSHDSRIVPVLRFPKVSIDLTSWESLYIVVAMRFSQREICALLRWWFSHFSSPQYSI